MTIHNTSCVRKKFCGLGCQRQKTLECHVSRSTPSILLRSRTLRHTIFSGYWWSPLCLHFESSFSLVRPTRSVHSNVPYSSLPRTFYPCSNYPLKLLCLSWKTHLLCSFLFSSFRSSLHPPISSKKKILRVQHLGLNSHRIHNSIFFNLK